MYICGNTHYSKNFIREVFPYDLNNLEANQHIENPTNGVGISFEVFQEYKPYESHKQNEQISMESERIKRENYERKMREEAVRKENEEKQQLWLKEIQDNPQLFNQQKTWIIDSNGNRWLKCEECGAVKLEPQFADHGGPGRLNLGICKECLRKR